MSKPAWRKNIREERKAQRSRWRKRQREKHALELEKPEVNNLLEELQKEKKLKKEADCKACEQEQRAVKLQEMYAELKKKTKQEWNS